MSVEDRARQSLALKLGRQSDLSRWSDERNLDQQWKSRAHFVAGFIEPPARVIDLGCGAMALEKALNPGITYIPADLVPRDNRTHVFDANAGQLPDVEADVAVALGLLEYVHDPAQLFAGAAKRWARLIVSYHALDVPGANPNRLAKGWLNAFNLVELAQLAHDAGYEPRHIRPFAGTDRIYDFRRSA